MTIQSDGIKGHLSALFTIIVWGSTFVATKVLLYQFGPVEIIFLRFLLGWSFLWLIRPKRLSIGNRKMGQIFFQLFIPFQRGFIPFSPKAQTHLLYYNGNDKNV